MAFNTSHLSNIKFGGIVIHWIIKFKQKRKKNKKVITLFTTELSYKEIANDPGFKKT